MPVVMMSGHATIDTAVEATRIGACSFLEKPIALQKLLKTVSQALERISPKEAVKTNSNIKEYVANQTYNGAFLSASKEAQFNLANKNEGSVTTNLVSSQELSPGHFDLPLREARDIFEKAYFEYHLKQTGGSMTRVSEQTGLERTHLYRKLKALGIDVRKIGSHSNPSPSS
jgi:DNA-binding NtrC family response regulator